MKSATPRSLHGRWPWILAGLTAAAGILLSLSLRSRIAQTETAEAQLIAATLRLDTEQELNQFADVLESVRALHALSDAVDQAAMDEFIEKGLVHQLAVLGPFGLAQRIGPQLRFLLEQQAVEGTGGYRVVKQGPDKTWIPVEPLPAHYPLTWQSQTGALNIPVGFDFSSIAQARQTIGKIEQTRRTQLVPIPIPDFSSNGKPASSPAYWVFSPVISNQLQTDVLQRFGAVIGFAVAELHPEKILKTVRQRSSISPKIRLTLDNEPQTATRRGSRVWHISQPMQALGATWAFSCTLPVSGHRSAGAFFFGCTITALMTSLLLILGTRTKKIEAEVCVRTEQLHLANAQLEENLRDRVQLEDQMHELAARERRKIGRDLHDSLGQKLTGAVFLSRSLMDYLKLHDAEQQAHAKTLNETLKSAVAQVRNMAHGLAPVTINDEQLDETLTQLAEEMTGLYGISCELTACVALPDLDQKTKEQLYLIAREAVNNAARHASAGRITLRLTGNKTSWTLRIEDDGQGLPEKKPASAGMGIRIMRHRASLIAATFSIVSAPGKGTRIEIQSNPLLETGN